MSYSGAAAAPAPEQVSEFVYQVPDSGDAGENQRSSAENSKESANSPRVSEKELSRIVAEARAEGFREGQNEAHKKFEADLTAHKKFVSEAIASFEQEREKYFLNVEGQLVHLALAIAGKILHREAQVDRMVVAGLVKVALERMQQTTKAVIRIRPEDALSWRHYFNTSPDLEIIEDPTLEPNACRIETELGVAEMGLDAQLKEVENGFFDLLAQRPGAQ
ncbi:MAG: FliH/SctL family protein [Terriglobales bacterium]